MAGKKDTNDLLPSGSGPEASDVDLSDLRVNFSEEEAASEAFSYDPVPTGSYNVNVTGIETRFSTSEKNNGKPYWAVEMTVQDGPYEGRKFWGNVMLFDGALYSLSQLLKATGFEAALKTGKVPPADDLVGKTLTINVVKTRDTYRENQNQDGVKLFKNEVKGYKALQDAAAPGAGASGSLLP
jgi:hypothetical protein